MLSKGIMRCPECGGEMIKHEFNGRIYYICKNCGKELVVPLSFF